MLRPYANANVLNAYNANADADADNLHVNFSIKQINASQTSMSQHLLSIGIITTSVNINVHI